MTNLRLQWKQSLLVLQEHDGLGSYLAQERFIGLGLESALETVAVEDVWCALSTLLGVFEYLAGTLLDNTDSRFATLDPG